MVEQMVQQRRMGNGEARMNPLYACVHAAEFPVQALLRLRPDLASQPIAVLAGRPPLEFVCSLNTTAMRRGITLDMTRLHVEALGAVTVLRRSTETESAARNVLLECAARFSPRIEECGVGTSCAFVLDITGTERLFGPPLRFAERLRSALDETGFRVSIAVSANFHAARMKAASSRGITVIPPGEEPAALTKLPLAALNLEESHREIFDLWGIRTLAELAALPEIDLITRLGQPAAALRAAARGAQPHTFQPIERDFQLHEFFAFETPVEQVDSLLFIGARMIDSLVRRAADRALALSLLTTNFQLEGGASARRILRPAIPSSDSKFLLKLLQLEIAAHPPSSAVCSFELTAEAARSSVVQLGLFAPQTPEPSRLDVTLARLRSIVGDDRVGSPALEDTHRPRSFSIEPFSLSAKQTTATIPTPRIALRCMRPPIPLRVTLRNRQPISFSDGSGSFQITASYGPWSTSGCWWSTDAWNCEEWDVLATRNDGVCLSCLLVCDRNAWRLEALYD
jgi:protein ImuB